MTGRFVDKVAVVTGAASGIGFACARRYAEEGAKVVGIDCAPCDRWHEIEALAPQAIFYQQDVTDGAAMLALATKVRENQGSIDILVTSAGVADAGPVHAVDEDSWQRVIDINLKGTFLSIKAVLPTMMVQHSGSIITIASIEGLMGTEGGSSYNASKGGVVLLSKNVAIDYGRLGIRCNAICPGFIDTPMMREVMGKEYMAEFKADVRRNAKLGRFGEPEEVAGVAYFLASEDASYVTGQAIAVDGGYTSGHSHGVVEMMDLV